MEAALDESVSTGVSKREPKWTLNRCSTIVNGRDDDTNDDGPIPHVVRSFKQDGKHAWTSLIPQASTRITFPLTVVTLNKPWRALL